MPEKILMSVTVPTEDHNERCDKVAAKLFSSHSRSCLQNWIKQGLITIEGQVLRPKDKVLAGQKLRIHVQLEDDMSNAAQEMPLSVIYEDEAILVINKPVGLVVHPGAGHRHQTLLNGLLAYHPNSTNVPRAGIIHRLDKDTSGLMVVAKTLAAHTYLVKQLQERKISRIYRALCYGCINGQGIVDAPIGRHPSARTKMAVILGGKSAVTHYQVLQSCELFSYLQLQLETGRTHQIRVHMTYKKHPLIGDPVYGKHFHLSNNFPAVVRNEVSGFERQALHAYQLKLVHPISGKQMSWMAPLPEDFSRLLAVLKEYDENKSNPGDL